MVGYHGVPRADLDSVMSEGLLRDRTQSWGCQQGGHVAIAETPEIAACFGDVVLVIDLDGLEGLSEFHGGEARVHGDICRERLTVRRVNVVPSLDEHIDPAKTKLGNHPACCFAWRLDGFDMADYQEIA
jgi:hypothetical protein